FKYTPAADYSGPDTIDVTVSDGFNGVVKLMLDVTVEPVNDAPECQDLAGVMTPEDTGVELPAACTDAENDTLTYSGTALHGTALHGRVTGRTYHPAQDYNGPDTITFSATDGDSSTSGTAQVTVTPVNDLPVCAPASASTAEDQGVAVTLSCTDVDSTVTYGA